MKRTIAALIALLLMLGTLCTASAQTVELARYTLQGPNIVFNSRNNTIALPDSQRGCYKLLAADGTELPVAPYIYMAADQSLYKVAAQEGTNIFGYIDGTGRELVPPQYGDLIYFSDLWQIGVTLLDATADNYDYKSLDGSSFYLVGGYDVYFDGAKVGTLARGEYKDGYAHGKYLYVADVEKNFTYYDSTLTPSNYQGDYPSSGEYEEVKYSIYHRGSGQQAFVPGCTLTSEDVELDIYEVNGRFLDLQGNEIFAADAKYDMIDKFRGDYARVRMNGKYGLIDRTGREVLACEYDEISFGDTYFEGGYQVAVKDGKVGYLNPQGEVTCEFKYAKDAIKGYYKMPATSLVDLEGNNIILSGAIGELSEHYAEVNISGTNGCPLIAVMNAEGQAGVIDLYGNAVIPLDGAYDNIYDFQISKDGTLVLAYGVDRTHTAFHFSFTDDAAVEENVIEAETQTGTTPPFMALVADARASVETASAGKAPAAAEAPATAEAPVADEAPAAVAQSEGWSCACGSVNTGKFCPECGSARPAEKLVCASCGYEPAEAAKFCSECGAPFAAN